MQRALLLAAAGLRRGPGSVGRCAAVGHKPYMQGHARTHYGHHHHDDDDHHHHGHGHDSHDLSGKEGQRITRVGLWVNVCLAAGKAAAGVMSGSAAMVADAAHSLSDLASDGVTLWALKISRDPMDDTHPYGHG
eukprot:CAMPEP_0182908040 /NCGR_PEP_ID=MMETSP0034_2-20130328/34947_1 /TAXON_ID=156128 /ORGANISM="Nephroselmis pyriformis, Strain CCMP717" /LENGTH=133 /DNA_ID=CAMNT_0025044145 /DNA_START=118 /DNA_END=516 /DNA_ORIENTATION=+